MVDEGSVQSPDDWHPIASPVAPLLSSRLDDAAARSADLPSAAAPISVFVLLAQCVASLQNLPDFLSAPTSLLEDSRHEAALALIGSLDANDPSSFATEFPFVPSRRMPTVIAAAKQRLTLLQRSLPSLSAPASSAPAPLANPSDLPLDQVQWAYDGSTCLAIAKGHVSIQLYVEALHEELLAQGVVCPVRQGHYMRRLLKNPLRKKLLDCIRSDMPEVAAAVAAGRAELMQHYAPALVSCADWPDLLAAHREATNPGRRDGEALRAATTRITQAWRAADALGCLPSTANRFCALFGLLTESERSLFTGRPSVLARMRRPLGETSEAASHRYGALLDELLAWARVQTTMPPRGSGGGERGGTGGTGGGGGGDAAGSSRGGGRRGSRRGGGGGSRPPTPRPALAAAATTAPSQPASDSDDSDAAAIAAPLATPASPRRRAPQRTFCYTGDRAQDDAETDRRMRLGLCLKCFPNGAGAARDPYPFGECPLHSRPEVEVPRVVCYRD